MNAAIEVDGLRKFYGATRAVDDVSFTVYEGEIFGLLGPNEAGAQRIAQLMPLTHAVALMQGICYGES